jgi:AmmeMemoRadiSam system protein B
MRRLEAFPVKHQGRDMIALRDPQGYLGEVALIPPTAYFIAALCDGTRNLREIQAAYVRRFGDIITTEQLASLLERLDEQLIIEGPRFRKVKESRDREYLALPNRPMTLAGRSYPAHPRELAAYLQDMLRSARGEETGSGLPRGLVSPHIDLERGWDCYGETYAYLARSRPPGARPLVVILGTCHAEMQGRFALTSKNYLTPFGLVETDVGVAEEVARLAGMQGLGDELSHRSEHSIEMQLPLLAAVFGGAEGFRILPVTCNSFHDLVEGGVSPESDAETASFIRALRGLRSALGDEVMFLAAADLAHVGKRFGGVIPVDALILSSVAAKDREMLDRAAEGDAEGFYSFIQAEGDSRHICGLPPIYAMVKALEGEKGRIIHYGRWFDPQEGSAVTFAGMAFPA